MAALHEVGIAYCLEHSGTRNEDESGNCNWAAGEAEPDDDGNIPPCRLVPLLFDDDAKAEVVDVEI